MEGVKANTDAAGVQTATAQARRDMEDMLALAERIRAATGGGGGGGTGGGAGGIGGGAVGGVVGQDDTLLGRLGGASRGLRGGLQRMGRMAGLMQGGLSARSVSSLFGTAAEGAELLGASQGTVTGILGAGAVAGTVALVGMKVWELEENARQRENRAMDRVQSSRLKAIQAALSGHVGAAAAVASANFMGEGARVEAGRQLRGEVDALTSRANNLGNLGAAWDANMELLSMGYQKGYFRHGPDPLQVRMKELLARAGERRATVFAGFQRSAGLSALFAQRMDSGGFEAAFEGVETISRDVGAAQRSQDAWFEDNPAAASQWHDHLRRQKAIEDMRFEHSQRTWSS